MIKELEDIEKQIKELNEKKAKIKAEEKKKLEKERDVRYQEVMDAYNSYIELRGKYVSDYGAFYLVKDNGSDIKFPSFWW